MASDNNKKKTGKAKSSKTAGTGKAAKTAKTGKAAGSAKSSKTIKVPKTGKASAAVREIDFRDPIYYTNRELSWVQFDYRVLGEAKSLRHPLMERLKFLSIVFSNLDEFFMVRVGSLDDMVHAGIERPDIAGMTPREQLQELSKEIHALVKDSYACFNKELLPEMQKEGITLLLEHEQMTDAEAEFADQYFESNIYPVLTPMAVDPSRPFPLIRNKSLNIGAMVRSHGKNAELEFATVQVPGVLPRVVELPGEGNGRRLIFLEEIIERNIGKLFLNYNIVCAYPYRITRNGDVSIDEDDTDNLLEEIEETIKLRQRGDALRLEVPTGIDKSLLKFLKEQLSMEETEIFRVDGPVDLTACMKLYGLDGMQHLKANGHTPQSVPRLPEGCDIFEAVRQGDVLMHHPYQSFTPVVDFIRQAASDPKVLAIKQTLYRVSGNSPIIKELARAAENGKQVTVLVELKARFDEEHNIVWARMLEKAGCHVIYGLMGLKTHSKITLVVRMEEDGIRRYVHLGTGNYNDATAKLYTDIGLLTCSESIGEDATAVFNMLSGYSEPKRWNSLSVAPLWLKDRMIYLIEREIHHASRGRQAHIIAKMNSLSDPDIIAALYKASSAGVKIDLIVRGICCLKVGIPGVSENITVRSIVGDFLEHARIFYFKNDEHPEVYCGSADWMPRNLDRRVEIVFPVEQEALKETLVHILQTQLEDNCQASVLQPEGRKYLKVQRRGRTAQVDSQALFYKEAVAAAKSMNAPKPQEARVFIPRTTKK